VNKERIMNIIQVKEVAKERGVKPGKLKKEELIRTIQLTEGNPQCYNTQFSHLCGQEGCLWREDCE
jgi:hypothetical protein